MADTRESGGSARAGDLRPHKRRPITAPESGRPIRDEDDDEEEGAGVEAPPPPPRDLRPHKKPKMTPVVTPVVTPLGFKATGGPPHRAIKISLGTTKLREGSASLSPKVASVAAAFNTESDSEPEEMPPEAKMRMKNIGRETPTSAGPNSFTRASTDSRTSRGSGNGKSRNTEEGEGGQGGGGGPGGGGGAGGGGGVTGGGASSD
ncbi:PEST proteolytic signal-containing nuclear protein [Lampetra fluviatilis]